MQSMVNKATPSSFVVGIFAYLALAWLLINTQACRGQSTQSFKPTQTLTYTSLESPQRIPEANVTFTVQIPPDTPKGQPIFLDIVDEVTGLALNQQRHQMRAIDEQHYIVTLSLKVGSVVKYRYSRQGLYTIIENTSNKRPVRYRLYRVDGPSQVQDVISTWGDTAPQKSFGRINGQVIDAKTNQPIPGLLITAGGVQTLTSSDGSFILEGLPPGLHTLVAYAMDGSYHTFQQGAVVAADSTTPAIFKMEPASYVNVIFNVKLPSNTLPGIPIRMAGNLTQLGNTFADLTGGISTIASKMPVLSPLPDGRYSIALTLPSGADLDYKYTLGDGFWNAEHDSENAFNLRHLIVPDTNTIINDEVYSWGTSSIGPILFDLTVPEYTPSTDTISVQFSPFGWTEPLPMWKVGERHWAYMLYSPLDALQQLSYRYCRNDQCGSADDLQTAGDNHNGRTISLIQGPQTIQDKVESWQWLQPLKASYHPIQALSFTTHSNFVAGIELQKTYHPSWGSKILETFDKIHDLRANWVFLTPTWTYTRLSPLVFEPVLGQDPTWEDLTSTIARAQAFDLKVAIFPMPNFQTDVDTWWLSTPNDSAWWQTWFELYRRFLIHHADLAEKNGADALILGGRWIEPILLTNASLGGIPLNTPPDFEEQWRSLVVNIREHFHGEILWATSYPGNLENLPTFVHILDGFYVLWEATLAQQPESTDDEFYTQASYLLDNDLLLLYLLYAKPIVLGISYPSAEGGATGCLSDELVTRAGECLNWEYLSRPKPDIPNIAIDLEEQASAYQAMFMAINERDWINGLVSRGFYPPAALQDKSSSIHGKPASDVLSYWFSILAPTASP